MTVQAGGGPVRQPRSKALEDAIAKARSVALELVLTESERADFDAALVAVGTAARELELDTCIGYLERRAEAIRTAEVELEPGTDPRHRKLLDAIRDTSARALEGAAHELVRLEHYK